MRRAWPPVGPIGPAGPPGATGATGATGAPGPIGPQGPAALLGSAVSSSFDVEFVKDALCDPFENDTALRMIGATVRFTLDDVDSNQRIVLRLAPARASSHGSRSPRR